MMEDSSSSSDDSRVVLHLDLDCFCALEGSWNLSLSLRRDEGQRSSSGREKEKERAQSKRIALSLTLWGGKKRPRPLPTTKKKIKTDCQVESQRLRLDPAAPLAVRQWQGLIAVNYAARKAGVTRHMTAREASRICPTIALAHVETLGDNGASDGGSVVFGGRGGDGAPSSSSSAAAPEQQFVPRKSDRKACLLRYRDASSRVLQALRSFFPTGTVIEKASIDEFYVDATSAVDAMLRPENGGCAVGVCEAAARAAGGAVVVEGFFDDDGEEKTEEEKKEEGEKGGSSSSPFPLDPTNPFDARLAAGAALASGARALILRETG